MTKEASTEGFGIVGVLILIAIVAIIAIAGWIVHKHQHKTKNNTNVASLNTSGRSNSKTSAKSKTQSSSTNQTYMDITQWGVKIPLSSEISNLYYVLSTSTQDSNGQPNTVWLGLKSITSTSCTPTALNTNNTELAAIVRSSSGDTDPVSGESLSAKYPNGTTIGSNYYALDDSRTLNSGCASQSSLENIDTALQSAAKNIVND